MSDFKTFMSIPNANVAEDIIQTLKTSKLDFRVQDTAKDFDATFASNNEAKNSVLIMLDPNDFEEANAVLDENTKFDISEIDPQHPLFSFSTNELEDVVKNYDEWHPIDVKLAKYLLEKQNVTVDARDVKEHQRVKEMKSYNQEKSTSLTLWMGYLFCLMGGLAGIGIALFLLTAKRKLPDGTKQFIYDESDRKHGFYMLLLGGFIVSLFLFIL